MAVSQENISKILSVLSHPIRREILVLLSEREECSFTELMYLLKVDTGKLSFHIRNLEAFLEQTPIGKYRLSQIGKNAIILIKDLEAWAVEAQIARKTTNLPLASAKKRTAAFLIDFSIAVAVFIAVPNGLSSLFTGMTFFLSINILLFLILFWVYLTLLEGFAGQTLGKRVLRLKTIGIDGKKLSYDQAAVRNFSKAFVLPVLPLDLLFGYTMNDERFLRYFDKFSSTTVLDLRLQASSTTST